MTFEEWQKETLNRFKEFGEGLVEANKIAVDQEEARLKLNREERKGDIWYGFANSFIKRGTHLADISRCTDKITDEFLQRFPS